MLERPARDERYSLLGILGSYEENRYINMGFGFFHTFETVYGHLQHLTGLTLKNPYPAELITT